MLASEQHQNQFSNEKGIDVSVLCFHIMLHTLCSTLYAPHSILLYIAFAVGRSHSLFRKDSILPTSTMFCVILTLNNVVHQYIHRQENFLTICWRLKHRWRLILCKIIHFNCILLYIFNIGRTKLSYKTNRRKFSFFHLFYIRHKLNAFELQLQNKKQSMLLW
jgi:hypothetical protein